MEIDTKIATSGLYLYDKDFADMLSIEFTATGSDKASHHAYHEIYAHLLGYRKVNTFLEIGLFLNETQHTDLFSWAKVFPNAEIYGADRKKNQLFNYENIKTFYVDQDDRVSLEELKAQLPKKIDVILDDASHMLDKTINTFEVMFDSVEDGGLYLIEDILIRRYSDDDWEQHADELDEYFSKTGLTYAMFSSSTIDKCVDSIVLCVYK